MSVETIGALRSKANMTLHTQYAIRIWLGRSEFKKEGESTLYKIISMKAFLAHCNSMKRMASLDNPYADLKLIELEDKFSKTRDFFDKRESDLNDLFQNLPDGLRGMKSKWPETYAKLQVSDMSQDYRLQNMLINCVFYICF